MHDRRIEACRVSKVHHGFFHVPIPLLGLLSWYATIRDSLYEAELQVYFIQVVIFLKKIFVYIQYTVMSKQFD